MGSIDDLMDAEPKSPEDLFIIDADYCSATENVSMLKLLQMIIDSSPCQCPVRSRCQRSSPGVFHCICDKADEQIVVTSSGKVPCLEYIVPCSYLCCTSGVQKEA